MTISKEQFREMRAGAQALCDWFTSQDVSPKMATAIMANVIAGIFLARTTDNAKLAALYREFGKLLLALMEVARTYQLNGDDD